MTAEMLTPEQREEIEAVTEEDTPGMPALLRDALEGRGLSGTDQVRLHVHADYLDRTGRRSLSRAIDTLLRDTGG